MAMTAISGLLCKCGQEAEGRCDWPVDRFESATVRELHVEDICANAGESRRGEVLSIESAELLSPGMVKVVIARHIGGKRPRTTSDGRPFASGRIDTYFWHSDSPVRILRRVPCGLPACYQHVRDLGADHFICCDHWGAQLEAIT